MPKSTLSQDPVKYLIHVAIESTEPSIWRRLEVPGSCTLKVLHNILQIVFGWSDDHLHEFQVQKAYASQGATNRRGGWFVQSRENISLDELFKRKRARFRYLYDFGDDWQMILKIEKTLPAGKSPLTICCVGGEKAGPPEDCGGPFGFYDLLEIMQRAKNGSLTDEEQETLEWLGDEYNPDEFNVEQCNSRLSRIKFANQRSGKSKRDVNKECIWGGVTVEVDLPGVPPASKGGPAVRPVLALWFDLTDDSWLTDEDAPIPELVAAHAGTSAETPASLLQAFHSPLIPMDNSLPRRPTVVAAGTAADLELLQKCIFDDVAVDSTLRPELVDLAEEMVPDLVNMATKLFEVDPTTLVPTPGEPGIDENFAREWLRAVCTFADAQVWDTFDDSVLLKVACDGFPDRFIICMGAAGEAFGMICMDSLDEVVQFLEIAQEVDLAGALDESSKIPPYTSLNYDPREVTPPVLEEYLNCYGPQGNRAKMVPHAAKSTGSMGTEEAIDAREFLHLATTAEALATLCTSLCRLKAAPQPGSQYAVPVESFGEFRNVKVEVVDFDLY